jgi:hypothetical protein
LEELPMRLASGQFDGLRQALDDGYDLSSFTTMLRDPPRPW